MHPSGPIDPAFSKWSPQLIKAAIAMRGMTLTRLAENNGLNRAACRQSLVRPQPKADRVISKFLGVPLCKLWPDRYDVDGEAIRHVRADTSADHAETHRQIVGAR